MSDPTPNDPTTPAPPAGPPAIPADAPESTTESGPAGHGAAEGQPGAPSGGSGGASPAAAGPDPVPSPVARTAECDQAIGIHGESPGSEAAPPDRAVSASDVLLSPPPGASAPELPDFGRGVESADRDIDLLGNVELNVQIQLGRAQMMIEDVLKLGEGSVVELDKLAGDPVDVLVNDRLVARGEILVLNENFCVRVSEIVAGDGNGEE